MENPFADYGKIIKGERFVGRKKEIADIQNRVFGSSFGNLAIQGLPRIGKSSLAWNAIIEKKDELEKRNIIPIRINTGSFQSSGDFILKLIKELHRAVKRLQPDNYSELQKLFDGINQANRADDMNDQIGRAHV